MCTARPEQLVNVQPNLGNLFGPGSVFGFEGTRHRERRRLLAPAFHGQSLKNYDSNWSGVGVYRLQFEDTFACYYTPLLKVPVAGLAAVSDGADGRGLVFQMALLPKDFQAMRSPQFGNACTVFGTQTTTFHDCTARFTTSSWCAP